MNSIVEQIYKIGIVPVIKIDDVEDAYPLGKALCEGGLPVAEVTFRTEHAKEAMRIMNEKLPMMLLGAGTVLTTKQVDDAIEVGAKFIVSPGLNPEIVKYCINKNIPVIPGCANASDIEVALSFGLDIVKFFPAETLGGLKMIKALAAPYTNVKFMPTGGVKENNIVEYLNYDRIVACGGTWMIDSDAIKNKDFDKIKQLTQNAVKKMLGLTLAHVGVNATEDTNESIADEFSNLLLCEKDVHTSACFAGNTIEVTKTNKGSNGHIAYSVYNVERAIRYYESLGYKFDETSVVYGENNTIKAIYFKNEIGGFKIHLLKK